MFEDYQKNDFYITGEVCVCVCVCVCCVCVYMHVCKYISVYIQSGNKVFH